MTKIKIGINGFGRIGRNVLKLALERGNIEIVGINDLTSTKVLAHLLKYDSTQGKFNGTVEFDENNIILNGKKVPVSAERMPINIPWAVTPDVVIECTGVFRSRESNKGGYGDHLKNGARKVILCVPSKDQIDATIVMGVNDADLKDSHQCISNASCTTNCLAPLVHVILKVPCTQKLPDRFNGPGVSTCKTRTAHADHKFMFSFGRWHCGTPHRDAPRAPWQSRPSHHPASSAAWLPR